MVTYQDVLRSANRPLPVPADDSTLTPDGVRPECEEMLIIDARAHLGPAQLVENKLSTMLGGALVPVSHVRMLTQLGKRNHC